MQFAVMRVADDRMMVKFRREGILRVQTDV